MSSDNCVLFSRGTSASVMGGRCWQEEMTEDARQLAILQANWAAMRPLWLPNSDISAANIGSSASGGLNVMISGTNAANCSNRVKASAAADAFADAAAAIATTNATATATAAATANCSRIKASTAAANTFDAAAAVATATTASAAATHTPSSTITATTAAAAATHTPSGTITATPTAAAGRSPPQLPAMAAGSSCCSNTSCSIIPHKAAYTRLLVEGPEAACLASTTEPSSSQHQQALSSHGGGGPFIHLMNNYNSCARSWPPPSPLPPNFGRLLPHLAESAPPPSHLQNHLSPHDNPSLSPSETCHPRLAPSNPAFGPNPHIIKNEALDEDVTSNSPLDSVKRPRRESGSSHIKVKGEQVEEVSPKRSKNAASSCKKKEDIKQDEAPRVVGKNKASKPNAEAPKTDFIHVRARRGQATDSHSLAERVRREKISERMRFLQDLVPGCNKITGKAMMLDEIINYVQSLQHQVEFLAMKLAALNPKLDFTVSNPLEREVIYSMDNGSELNMDICGNDFLCSDYHTTQNISTFYLESCNDIDVSIRTTDMSIDNSTGILDY